MNISRPRLGRHSLERRSLARLCVRWLDYLARTRSGSKRGITRSRWDDRNGDQAALWLLAAVQRCCEQVRGEPTHTDTDARREEGFWAAVLPFKFTGDPEIALFAEGLTEEIIAGLSRFPYLRVIARSSMAHYLAESDVVRKVGNELGARYLVEGTLRQAGNKLRVAVRLVDAESEAHLWAETFERDWHKESVFQLQDELTDRIVAPIADIYGLLARAIFATTAGGPRRAWQPMSLSGGSFSPNNEALRRITCSLGLRSSEP